MSIKRPPAPSVVTASAPVVDHTAPERAKQKSTSAITVPHKPVRSSREIIDAMAATAKATRISVMREVLDIAERANGADIRPYLRSFVDNWDRTEAAEKQRKETEDG